MKQIDENIWMGTTTEALDENAMHNRDREFTAILSCTTVKPPAAQAIPGVVYGHVDVPDYTPWSEDQKQYAAHFIHETSQSRLVFVHSDMGISRAPARTTGRPWRSTTPRSSWKSTSTACSPRCSRGPSRRGDRRLRWTRS